MIIGGFLVFLSIVAFEKVYEGEIAEWFKQPVVLNDERQSVEEVSSIVDDSFIEKEKVSFAEHERFIGLTADEVTDEFGEPKRIDLSAYGYDWWIYPTSNNSYMQIGIEDDQVVTVFLTGDIRGKSLSFGQTYNEINELLHFQKNVDVKTSDGGVYQFELTDEDVNTRPIAELGGHWVQFYFDSYTKELSSMRIIVNDVLIRQRPYSVSYRGSLPERPVFSKDEWSRIESGNARQIFDFTNVIRSRHGLDPFEWEGKVAEVAYLHSMDMSNNQYFSHTSPTYGELSDRFSNGDVPFMLAGENIAAKYIDGVASVEGWLNSEGHRVNILHKEFTHLGVGVYQEYYTQNFMTPWQL